MVYTGGEVIDMRIKEVEALTGLTAKAIRLYEAKGLLSVARQLENDYRDYSQEDVKRLQTIAVLRRLDVPVKTIKSWTDGERSLSAILEEVSLRSEENRRENCIRKELADHLIRVLEDRSGSELPEMIDEISELRACMEELDALAEELDALSRKRAGDLMFPVWMTVVCLGPVGMTLLRIVDGQTDQMIIGYLLSLICVVLTAFAWTGYYKTPKHQRDRNGCLPVLLACVLSFVGVFAMYIGIEELQRELFISDERMILLFRGPWCYLVLVIALVLMGGLFLAWLRPWRDKSVDPKLLLWSSMAILVFSAVLLYGCVNGVSVASEEGITRYHLFDPQGHMYRYEDVVKVETGFKGKLFGLPTRGTGEFYYRITYTDGMTEDWGSCSSEYDADSWLWMIRLDDMVMAGGADKIASEAYSEYCDMDQVYVDVLLEVIRNDQR